MKFNPPKHHRHSTRLPDYDYSQPGAYFITMVTDHRECLFGNIVNGEMQLSRMGQIAEEHLRLIPDHFPYAELGAYVVMPNHVHVIIIIRENGMATKSSPSVGASQLQTVRNAVPLGPSSVPTKCLSPAASNAN